MSIPCPDCGGKGYNRIGIDHDERDCMTCHKTGRIEANALRAAPTCRSCGQAVGAGGHQCPGPFLKKVDQPPPTLLSIEAIAEALTKHAAAEWVAGNDDRASFLRRLANQLLTKHQPTEQVVTPVPPWGMSDG